MNHIKLRYGTKRPAHLPDELLFNAIHTGDKNAIDLLLEKYKRLVYKKAAPYFAEGCDKEDVIQEGMIALFEAITHFDVKRCALFQSFATICIKGRINSFLRANQCQKHQPLNTYISFDKEILDQGMTRTLIEVIADQTTIEPSQSIIMKERLLDFKHKTTHMLSSVEQNVLKYYLLDLSYREIAQKLSCSIKTVDNALQRIRKKMQGVQKQIS